MSDHSSDADLRAAIRGSLLGEPLPKRRVSDDQLIERAIDSLAALRVFARVYTPKLRHLVAMRSHGPMDCADRADLEMLVEANPLRRRAARKVLEQTDQLAEALRAHGIEEDQT